MSIVSETQMPIVKEVSKKEVLPSKYDKVVSVVFWTLQNLKQELFSSMRNILTCLMLLTAVLA
jgi:hypothetical protein